MKTIRTPDVDDVVPSLRLLLNSQVRIDATATAQSLEALIGICTTALDTVAAPLCAVCSDGRLLFANSAARRALALGQWLESSGGRINTSAYHSVAPSFDQAMDRLRSGEGSTLLLTDRRNGQRAMVSVAPVYAATLGLVWLTTSEAAQTPVKHMAQLFNLTSAEQNVLACLTGGFGPRDAAVHLKVSIHTVRNQLKSILSKTGRHSQAQLLTLVTRMASLRLPDHV
jgi:DNA-binding CsgD family transcriptional regulator